MGFNKKDKRIEERQKKSQCYRNIKTHVDKRQEE